MTLVRWQPRSSLSTCSPFHTHDHFHKEMNRLFDWSLGRHGAENQMGPDWAPPVDIVEEEGRFLVRADLPGMKHDEIEVTLDGDTLTLGGEKKQEMEVTENGYFKRERYQGKFTRSLILPSTVDPSRIEATYKDGVLELSIPKTEAARPKQIKVQAA